MRQGVLIIMVILLLNGLFSFGVLLPLIKEDQYHRDRLKHLQAEIQMSPSKPPDTLLQVADLADLSHILTIYHFTAVKLTQDESGRFSLTATASKENIFQFLTHVETHFSEASVTESQEGRSLLAARLNALRYSPQLFTTKSDSANRIIVNGKIYAL